MRISQDRPTTYDIVCGLSPIFLHVCRISYFFTFVGDIVCKSILERLSSENIFFIMFVDFVKSRQKL